MVKGYYELKDFTGRVEWEFDGDKVFIRAISESTGKIEFEKEFISLKGILKEMVQEGLISGFVATTVRSYIRNGNSHLRTKMKLRNKAVKIGNTKYNYPIGIKKDVKRMLLKILPKKYLIK